MSLLRHKDLRGVVRSFWLTQSQRQPAPCIPRHLDWVGRPLDPRGSEVGDSLWRHITDVKDALDELLGPCALPVELNIV
jgi:hypothetical protein